jgi:hypothetical protein
MQMASDIILRCSKATSSILDGIAEAIDHLVLPKGTIVATGHTIPSRKKYSTREVEKMIKAAKAASNSSIHTASQDVDPQKVISSFPSFSTSEFSLPDRIENMNLEIEKVESKDMFQVANRPPDQTYYNKTTGEKIVKKSDAPIIAVKGTCSLDDKEMMAMLTMRDSFSFLSEFLFEVPYSWSKEQSEEVFSGIVSRIMKKTNWSYEEVLVSILIRDFIRPMVIQSNKQKPEALDETVRLYLSSNGKHRWAMMPYHSPSISLGNPITPEDEDFPGMPGDEDYGEGSY